MFHLIQSTKIRTTTYIYHSTIIHVLVQHRDDFKEMNKLLRNIPANVCPYCHNPVDNRNNYGYYHTNQMQPYFNPMPYWYPVREPEPVIGKASWTWGGMPTKCEIFWSYNEHMTASVGEKSPFKCGQKLKVKNISFIPSKEVLVTVVDQVKNYPANRINLHRKAFEALGVSPSVGVIDVEITPVYE